MSRPEAPRRRTLEASRTSGGTSPRRPAQTTHFKWVLNTKGLTTQGLRLLTFIHRSAWRTASRCRATVVGSTRSSANSLSPPRLLVEASVIDVERIGSASWISSERTTTSRAGSGSASSPSPPVIAAASSVATSIGSGLLQQPLESPVPHPQRAPPTGCRSPRPQNLSTREQVHQSYLATTTTLLG
jgi:hypothetical protein